MTASYHPSTHPLLKRKAKGEAVTQLQTCLCQHLPKLNPSKFVDGIFGGGTEHAVRVFQRKSGLTPDGCVGKDTWRAVLTAPKAKPSPLSDVTAPTESSRRDLVTRVKKALSTKGYEFFDDGKPYYLNIIGVRANSTDIDHFDDQILVIYRDESNTQICCSFSATTDPGQYYTQEKLCNAKGAAILQPGQYRNVYQIDLHGGKYKALCQRGGPVRVWRDGDMDNELDMCGQTDEGYFGINIHRASVNDSERVGRYSAGCQVLQKADDFNTLMALAERSEKIRGNAFSYTLLNENDLSPN